MSEKNENFRNGYKEPENKRYEEPGKENLKQLYIRSLKRMYDWLIRLDYYKRLGVGINTTDEEVKEAIEIFKKEDSDAIFETEIVASTDILETYLDDDTFLGIAINPPKYDFVIFSQNVIEDHQDCC